MAGTKIEINSFSNEVNTIELDKTWKERLKNAVKFGAFTVALGIVISIGPAVEQAQAKHEPIREFVAQDAEYSVALGAASALLFAFTDTVLDKTENIPQK